MNRVGLSAFTKECKGFIVYTVNIGNISTYKVKCYCEKLLKKIKQQRPNGWKSIIVPVRNQFPKIEVFTLSNNEIQEIERFIIDNKHSKLVRFNQNTDRNTDDEIRDYVLLYLGLPCVDIDRMVSQKLNELIEEAKEYDINNPKKYVLNRMKEETEITNNKITLNFHNG